MAHGLETIQRLNAQRVKVDCQWVNADTTPVPRGGETIIAIGQINIRYDDGGECVPFLGFIRWNETGWLDEHDMAVEQNQNQTLVIHFWSHVPNEDTASR